MKRKHLRAIAKTGVLFSHPVQGLALVRKVERSEERVEVGFISDLAKNKAQPIPSSANGSFVSNREASRSTWRRVFENATDKETPHVQPTTRSNSYGRTFSGSDASVKKLLQALRSMAPGGWSDNRAEMSRHFHGIQYVAIHRVSEQLAQSEFQVYEKDESQPDGKRPTKSEGGEKLIKLLEKPNWEDSFGDLLYQTNLQMSLTGLSHTWMVPNRLMEPMELYPIPTATIIGQPVIMSDEYPEGFYRVQPIYPYGPFSNFPTPNTSVGAAIPAQWMLRIKYPHPLLRYDGWSPLTAMRQEIDQLEAINRSRWYSMQREMNPSAVLQFEELEGSQPLPEDQIERIKAEFENEIQGPQNAGRLYVGMPGSKLEPFGKSPKDMDYPQGWEQMVSYILGGGFGITKPAAGMIEDSAYSNLYATLKQLYWLTLEPIANRISAKLTRHLAPFFGDNLIIEIRCKRLDDHDILFSKLDILQKAQAITKNEVRFALEFPLTSESWGEEVAGTEAKEDQMFAQNMAMQADAQAMAMQPPMPPNGEVPMEEEASQPDMEGGGLMDLLGNQEMLMNESSRPNPGKMAHGSLGQRMKSLRMATRNKASKNGKH